MNRTNHLFSNVFFGIMSCILACLMACQSNGVPIDADLTPIEFFQKAQEASEIGNYELAIDYYRTFRERYPDLTERNLWAAYEIAFLHHKMGEDDVSLDMLQKLSEKDLPRGLRTLTEQVISSIQNQAGNQDY